MPYETCPALDIDLRLDPAERWAEIIRSERRGARALLRGTLGSMSTAQRGLLKLAGPAFRLAYMGSGGRYVGELDAWADGLGISRSDLLILNCTYELSHLDPSLPVLGCTAGVRWVPGLGLVHVRSMDWPIRQIGSATRIFRFRDGRREFVSVGILGHVGVLSGMLPGKYSVTINWAPPVRLPRFSWGPAFLLREVLETCDTYEDAVATLAGSTLATSTFYVVAGTRRGQACVIERAPNASAIREMKGDVLVAGNHHLTRKFRRNNDRIAEGSEDETSLLEDSRARVAVLERELARDRAGGVEAVAGSLDAEPVCNSESYQQMAFCPRTRAVHAWGWMPERRSR